MVAILLTLSVLVGVLALAGVWWLRHGPAWKAERLERDILAEICEGRYHRAVPYLVERGRVAEAAHLEALRGNTDQAARLYERAGDVRGAASVYLTLGEPDMAALIFKDGGLKAEAARAFSKAGRPDAAGPLFEEVGELDRAVEAYRATGHEAKVESLLEKLGRTDEASLARAERLEAAGRHGEAARSWERAGAVDRAVRAWVDAAQPHEAVRILTAGGRQEDAARLLQGAGEFAEAARLFEALKLWMEAAHAHYRAGNVSRAVQLLKEQGDWVTLGRIYLQHGLLNEALDTLAGVPRADPAYFEAKELLADAFLRDGRTKDAVPVLEELVSERHAEGHRDGALRRVMVQLAEVVLHEGDRRRAIATLKRLETLGLMTDDLHDKLQMLVQQASVSDSDAKTGSVEVGATLGVPQHDRYEFLSKIGQGGNGVIYKARDKMLDRILVIKMIGQTALPSDMARQFFLREAQTAARLNHPNIVTVYDMGEMEGRPYIAMELVEGRSLADILADRKGPMPAAEVVPISKQLCDALDYAHSRDVVHRDIKLENVMVTDTGDVKLMDFGLAKAIHGSPDRSLVITGTPLYMSPEQIVGEDVDGRSDIYSLGVMLFRLLVGKWPYFDGNILEHHRFSDIPDPTKLNPELTIGFKRVVTKTLAKHRSDRYSRASDVARHLAMVFRSTRS